MQNPQYLENVRAQETLASAITIFMGCTSIGDPNLRARLRPAPFPRPGLRGYVRCTNRFRALFATWFSLVNMSVNPSSKILAYTHLLFP